MLPLVDLHHHFVPAGVMSSLRRLAGGGHRLVDERLSMTLSPDLSDLDAHLEAMAAAGVGRAVLSYSGLSVLGGDVCAAINDGVAAACETEPDRFAGAAHVDPAAPEPAARELERCVAELGFPVAAIPCSGPGWSLDSPALHPLWERAAALGLPVVLHPALKPAGATTDYGIERCCARPADTVEAVVRILNHVLAHWPELRFVAPHLGGGAVFLKGRIAGFFRAEPLRTGAAYRGRTAGERRGTLDETAFAERWDRLCFDTAGTSAWSPPVEFAARTAGADHLVFGSDYPLEAHSPSTYAECAQMVRDLPLTGAERAAIAQGTAASLGVAPGAGAAPPGGAARTAARSPVAGSTPS